MANIPLFTGFYDNPGGWPWDFWTINMRPDLDRLGRGQSTGFAPFLNDREGMAFPKTNKGRTGGRRPKKIWSWQTVFLFPAEKIWYFHVFFMYKNTYSKTTGTGALLRHPDFLFRNKHRILGTPFFFARLYRKIVPKMWGFFLQIYALGSNSHWKCRACAHLDLHFCQLNSSVIPCFAGCGFQNNQNQTSSTPYQRFHPNLRASLIYISQFLLIFHKKYT